MSEFAQNEYDVAAATTSAPEPETPLEVQLLIALEESGVTIPNDVLAIEAIQPVLDEIADQRGAETLRMIFMRLPGGRHGTELRLALTQAIGFEVEAKRLGISRQSLSQAVKRLQNRVFPKRRLPHPTL
jgi:hypothetical protein